MNDSHVYCTEQHDRFIEGFDIVRQSFSLQEDNKSLVKIQVPYH